MCMVLKTYKLTKNPLVHLFYLILIVSTVENRVVEKPVSYTPAPTEENINNVDKGSTINIKDQQQSDYKNPFNNIVLGLSQIPKKLGGFKPKEEEIDIDHPPSDVVKESAIDIEDQQQGDDENPFSNMMLGLSEESTTNRGLEPLEEKIDTDPLQSDVNKESKINIEDQQQDDDENPFSNMMLGLSEESTTNRGLEPLEEEIDTDSLQSDVNRESKINIEDQQLGDDENQFISMTVDPSPESATPGVLEPIEEEIDIDHRSSDVDEESTSNGGIKEKEEKQKAITELVKRLNSRYTINPTNTNEINNIGTNADNDIEDQQQGDDENPFSNMMLDPSLETTTLGNFEPEDMKEAENDQNTEDGITNSKKKKKKKKEINKSKIIPDSEDDNMLHSLEPINSEDLIVSSLENVDIIKIKEENPESEAIRKEKKKQKFEGFKPRQENARIYCTFLGNVLKMYKKVRKRFVGQFCHAVVIGTPIILKNYRVHLSEKMKDQLQTIYPEKDQSLLIVIMQYQKYTHWKKALSKPKNMNKLITDIINTVVYYKIDGIQFSNLHPIKETVQVDKQMMNHLVEFFEKLQVAAAKAKKYDLKIGITIDTHGLSITKSLSSFKNLNAMVTWYSFKTISMVKCDSKYETSGTSPLEDFKMTINTLIGKIVEEFDMTKLVVGIQLFPNKINDLRSYTYEEFCSSPKDTWHGWCAMNPEDLRLKGRFLRGAQIGGVQLYYMHSDDYRSTCGCYSFPLIRALLRGLIKYKTPETCDFRIAHN